MLVLLRSRLLFISIVAMFGSFAAQDVCETIDGDCPDDCAAAGFAGTLDFTALLDISPLHPDIERNAASAEAYILEQGEVASVDAPATSLHTSLFYFCCHTPEEKDEIKNVLHNMSWRAFSVNYDSFACNLDHDNSTIYLHGLPTNQTGLFDLASNIEATVEAAGIPINHPRKSLFHMTLARVGYDYPVDDVVNYFLADPSKWGFGDLLLNEFAIGKERYTATGER
jgi:2'-5' RNA ligase